MSTRILNLGIIGGGQGAFIGAVHRAAAELDGAARIVAGCLSSTPERARASALAWNNGRGLPRSYDTFEAMLDAERGLPEGQRIDAVIIVTPNHLHHPAALAALTCGFHVVCDKPLVHTSAQAAELRRAAAAANRLFAVTYNYSGYPMVKQARHLVRTGALGVIRKVIVEYHQGWLAANLEATGQKQADWRTDPARSGVGGAIGDIGSHAEQLASTVTGLEIEALCADLTTFVPGRALDDDANLLLRFHAKDGVAARGVLIASQIEIGCENDLRLRVFGDAGSIEWRQEEPNMLIHRPLGEPERTLRRGNAGLCDEARAATRLPPGHPEAFIEAFANIYRNVFAAILAGHFLPDAPQRFDFPGLDDGSRGVRFIERTVESARSDQKWLTV